MVTRHSKQIPIPHSGALGWPLTEWRKALILAMAIAAATVLPVGTFTWCPLIVRRILFTYRLLGADTINRSLRRDERINWPRRKEGCAMVDMAQLESRLCV